MKNIKEIIVRVTWVRLEEPSCMGGIWDAADWMDMLSPEVRREHCGLGKQCKEKGSRIKRVRWMAQFWT